MQSNIAWRTFIQIIITKYYLKWVCILFSQAIYFTSVNFFFFNWAKLSQNLMDRFSRYFHLMEGICVNVVNPVHFFQFLKGRCHGNQFCVVADLFARSRSISGSAGPIFTIFAPYGRYWIADERYVLLFFDILRDVAMATNLVAKMGQNYLPPCTYRSVIPKRNGISPCKYAHL